MSDSIDKKIDDLTSAVVKGFNGVQETLGHMRDTLDIHGEKIDRLQTRVGAIGNRLDVISDDIRVLKTFKENQEEYKIPERVKRLEKTAGIEAS